MEMPNRKMQRTELDRRCLRLIMSKSESTWYMTSNLMPCLFRKKS